MKRMTSIGAMRILAMVGVCFAVALCMLPAAAIADAGDAQLQAGDAQMMAQENEHEHDGIVFEPWESDSSLPDTAGYYYLTKNVTLATTWNAPSGTKLCLAGHWITLEDMVQNEYIINVPAAQSFDLFDDSGASGQVKSNGYCNGIRTYGTFTMHGGTLIGTYSGVDIIGLDKDNPAEFAMTGGAITDLKNGRGAYLYGMHAKFTMSGGSIVNNSCHAGVETETATPGSFVISGAIEICDNGKDDSGIGKNVRLYLNPHNDQIDVITLAGPISNKKKIGVSSKKVPSIDEPVVFTSGYGAHMGDAKPTDYFVSDDSEYVVGWNADKTEAAIVVPVSVSFDANGGTGTMEDEKVAYNQPTALVPNTLERDGFAFTGWNTKADGTGDAYADGAEVTLTEGLTLYAQWAKLYDVIVKDAENGSVVVDKKAAIEGDKVKLTITPDKGYVLGDLSVTSPVGPVTVEDNVITMPAGEVTVEATFEKLYSVTVKAGANGSITADKAIAVAGDKVKLTITPDDGYALDDLIVGSPAGEVTVEDNVITMPAGDVFAVATFKMAQPPSPSSSGVMYRLYNPNSGEHFYTGDADERDGLVNEGWLNEGEAWTAPERSLTPVYRLYNGNEPLGDHHYTTNMEERSSLIAAGWTSEGVGWYSDDAKGVGLYRLYNPNAYATGMSGAHHYTADKDECDSLVELGWQAEGFDWYGLETA